MAAVLYPVATNANEILNQGCAAFHPRAARLNDAREIARKSPTAGSITVCFVSEFVGPEFQTVEEAQDHFAGMVPDERPGKRVTIDPEHCFCSIRPRFRRPAGRPRRSGGVPQEDKRWPAIELGHRTYYQLAISYWKVDQVRVAKAPSPAPDLARKKRTRRIQLSPQQLQQIADTPLQPVLPQEPLLFGLFSWQPAENLGAEVVDE